MQCVILLKNDKQDLITLPPTVVTADLLTVASIQGVYTGSLYTQSSSFLYTLPLRVS